MKVHTCTYRGLILLLILWMAFIARAQDPTWEWYKELSTGGNEFITALAVDPADNSVYAVGNWSDDLSATWPDGTYAHNRFNSTYGGEDAFLVKYDSEGNYLWGFTLGSASDDRVNSVTVDNEGSVYITGFLGEGTGRFYGTSAPAGAAELTNGSNEDFFLAKYDAAGAFQWVRRSTSNGGNVEGRDVCTNSSSVFATGTFIRSADFGPLITGSNPLQSNLFLVCYDKAGNEQWIATAGSGDIDVGQSVVADDVSVYITGWFNGATLDIKDRDDQLGGILFNGNSGTPVIPIISFDLLGYFRWAQLIQSSAIDRGRGLCMDSDSLYITGTIDNNVDFPGYSGNPVPTSGNRDIFLSSHSKLDGLCGWVLVFPCSGNDIEKGRNLDITSDNHLIVTGEFRNTLTFPGGTSVTSAGSDDVFLAGYTTQGEFLWGQQAGSSGDEDGNAIAVGTNGNIYAGGLYDNDFDAGPFLLNNDAGDNGFLLKLKETFATPVNDFPCGALLLPEGDTCAAELHDNLEATDSGISDPGCGSYAGGDVWFKALVPESGNLFVGTHTTNNDIFPPLDGYMWNVNMAVYTGDCNALTQLTCATGNSAYNSRASSAFLFDQVPGDTVWIRVWEDNADHNGSFSICTYDPGHFPGWDLPGQICEDNGPIDLDTTLSGLVVGNADAVLSATGIPNPDFALGLADGNGAILVDNGDFLVLDLSDTIPAGETFVLNMRSNPLFPGESSMLLQTSLDDITYSDHPFRPETFSDVYSSHYILAEQAFRYLRIENSGSGGGGFGVDAVEYYFRATRGGSWSGPGVTGSLFDPAGLLGPVSITYSVGGSNTRTDSIRSVEVLKSLAGTLGNDTTVCSGDPGLQLNLQGYRGTVIGWESSTDGFLSTTPIPVFDAFLDVSGLAATTSYRALVQDGSCEPDTSDIITVNILEIPSADAGTGGDWCGPDYQLSAIPSIGTGLWTQTGGPGTASFNPSADLPDARVSVDIPGVYEFTWTETNGSCLARDSIDVNFLDNLVVDAGTDENVCGFEYGLNALPSDVPGNWITSYGQGSASFSAAPTDAMTRVSVDAYGEYMFRWEAALGVCTGMDSVIVVFHEPPLADAGPDQVLDHTFSTSLEALLPAADVTELNATGTWTLLSGSGILEDASDPATLVSGLELGENVFQWTISSDLCPAVSDQVMITVNDIETYTIITPNNDGLNDVLVFPGIEELNGCEIIIYNRWGMEVYRNENYQNNWEGRDHKDRPLIQDTYYYVLMIPPNRVIKSFVEIRRSQ